MKHFSCLGYIFALFVLCQLATAGLMKEQLKQLALASPDGIIHADDHLFKQLFYGARKDYYLATVYTAVHPQFGCSLCGSFDPSFRTVAASWNLERPDSEELFFVILDFSVNEQTFNMMNMKTVPHCWIYGPTDDVATKPQDEHFGYKIPEDPTALHFADFLSKLLSTSILVHVPFDTQKFVKTFAISFAVILFLKKRAAKLKDKLGGSFVYCTACILLTVLFVTGFSFAKIKLVPLLARNEHEEIMYISGGYSYQFGSEIFIIGAIYLGLAALFVTLIAIQKAPSDQIQLKTKNAVTILCCVALYALYSVLT
ncbi:hypothetical protein BABINDRAFT_160498, partial [Babjeviella inositovora NRRL Y-12698]